MHLISILAIVILFQRKPLEKKDETDLLEDAQTIHQSIEAFVKRMERENEVLYQKLVDYIKAKENKFNEIVQMLEEKLDTKDTEDNLVIREKSSALQQDSRQPAINELNVKQSKEEKISQLYKQGFSPKQIAKLIQSDIGEVELIINMLRKKQLL
ncbi:DUF6115 domain-containing protein [Bacillus taeanensis]|uniref:UBA domain-containing protein n=1 Tax=Bacillus taeanensis TaxID=273032 RepID=A0A366XRT0_9BACI|nr:hypothetical protein [Bacillus taeanensis]RBW67835.1 hypothetical protein DS031_20020 [Bacillus taeanensis]